MDADYSRLMFQTYYQLREQPFGVNPDPRFLYLSRTHREAFSSLLYRIQSDAGFLAMIAQPGMGKTTLLFHLLQKLEGTAKTAFVFQTQCTSHELLRHILSELECESGITDSVRMFQELKACLVREANAGRRCVLIVDEAQDLSPEVLETIRLLSNFETPRRKLVNIILSGQPELGEILDGRSLNQLRQRLSCMIRLQRFTPEETVLYIAHRLATAGYPGKVGDLFSRQGLTAVAQLSEGIPRVINNICFNALSLGYAVDAGQIDLDIIREAAGDLGITSRFRPSTVGGGKLNRASVTEPRSGESGFRYWREDDEGRRGVATASGAPVSAVNIQPTAASDEALGILAEEEVNPAGIAPQSWPVKPAEDPARLDGLIGEPQDIIPTMVGTTRDPVDEAVGGSMQGGDQRRKRNSTLAVVGGSSCALLLCIAAFIAFPLRHSVSALSHGRDSAATVGGVQDARPPVLAPQARSDPPLAVKKASTKASKAEPRNLSMTQSRRRYGSPRAWRTGQRRKTHVDLTLASFAPEPLINPLPFHPMTISASSRMTPSTPHRSLVRQRRGSPVYVPPRAIWQPAPTYTRIARRGRTPIGDVQLLLSVSSGGKVSDVGVLKGNRTLAAAAVRAVKEWKYHPALSNGTPVKSQVYITVQFQQQ